MPVLLFIGTTLMQAAWILAVPPFRGSDEFDHAYRAAAVAHGQWRTALGLAEDGRGELVVVPRSIVQAAEPECSELRYTGPDNCTPVEDVGQGMVTVASAASRYHPAFYWVIGAPAMAFEGAASLYVMRIVAALLCAGFIALSGWSITLWARTHWPLVAMVISMTPVLVYSTSLAAPNGIEMVAGLSIWAALLGLTRRDLPPSVERTLLWAAVPGGVVLATVRPMGPLWLAMIVLTVVVLPGARPVLDIIRRHRVSVSIITGLMTITALANVWWLRSAPVGIGADVPGSDPLFTSLRGIPLWFLQSIAAFPTRTEPAPVIVYAAVAVVGVALMAVAFRPSGRRLQVVIAAAILAGLAVAFAVSLVLSDSYGSSGPNGFWQGRYGLPYTVGVVLLAGLGLEAARFRHRMVGPALVAAWLALTTAHAVGATDVLLGELANSPSAGGPSWVAPAPWAVATLTVVGLMVWALAVRAHPALDDCNSPPIPTERKRQLARLHSSG